VDNNIPELLSYIGSLRESSSTLRLGYFTLDSAKGNPTGDPLGPFFLKLLYHWPIKRFHMLVYTGFLR